MRLGVMTDFGCRDAQEWAKVQRELGCRAVSFPINCETAKKNESIVDEFKKAARDKDLLIAEVGVWRNTLAADPEERENNIRYAIEQLALADRVGAKCCVNVAGTPHGPRWDGGYAANFCRETRKEIVKMVRRIVDEVNPKNTKFTLEPMPWMVPCGPDDYLQLLEEVDRDGFAVHLDFINMVTSPERYFRMNDFMDEVFEKLGGKICSAHLKDVKLLDDYTFMLKECACGEGIMDVKRYLDKITSIDPELPVIIEHLASDDDYRRSFHYVRSL